MGTAEVEIPQSPWLTSKRLDELYVRHADSATRFAYVLTGDRELARDLIQDAFVALARRLVHLRKPAAFEWYLRRMIVNLAASDARRRKAERARVEKANRLSTKEPDESDRAVDLDIRRALLSLPLRQRTAIVLRYYEDLSVEQTAEAMRCPTGTVKSLVARGLEAMRSEVER